MRISDWSSDVFSSDLIGLWKRVATLLQGQHNLTCAEADHEIREVVDCRTVNGFGDDLRPIIHCNVAHDGKAAAPTVGQPAVASGVAGSGRSEERRVGKECGRTCRSRWAAFH